MGYTFFNMNALTIQECNVMAEAYNAREREKAKSTESR
jgi:hypothetical protein